MVLDVVYAGVEVARQGRDTARGDIDAEELVLIAVAHASVGERIRPRRRSYWASP